MSVWDELAADGTDPDLLARLVARMAGPRGDPRTLAREAAERGLAADWSGDVTDPRALLGALAPRPGASLRSQAAAIAATWLRLGVTAAKVGDPAYPPRLAAGWPSTGAPPVLLWRGPRAGLPKRPAVAIVGARRASAYGTGVAAWLAEAASAAGVLVVSGGAVGVDAASHGAAIDGPGGTAVVLGCGHAVGYPRAHAQPGGLFERVLAADGWLVSELLPGTEPRPGNVLARNRIVAGLVDAVVVTEGGARSGSLRTAQVALERGTPVLAVPGDVRAPGSAAPHRLLSDGAVPCTSPGDLLAVLEVDHSHTDGGDRDDRGMLPPPVREELVRRWPRAIRVGELALATGLPVGRLLAGLTQARVAGVVAESAEGVRLTRAPRR